MARVVWYCSSAKNIASLTVITASESVCDVASMRAVFPPGIAIGCEWLSAMRAGERVDGFSIDFVLMVVPPDSTTFI